LCTRSEFAEVRLDTHATVLADEAVGGTAAPDAAIVSYHPEL
jgi:hypothetical protein